MKSLSVVIPLYNEQDRVGNLSKVFTYLKKLKFKSEVILVNDGSTDETLNKLKILSKKHKFSIINYSQNRGKGYAIRRGVIAAKKDHILFIDIDLSTPIEEFDKFTEILDFKNILIGSRRRSDSTIKKRQSIVRENLGRIFTYLSSVILGLKVSDFTCGFKCFPTKVAQRIFKKQRIERWGFDPEILFLAQKLGLGIKEIPVVWSNDTKSKVSLPKDIFESLSDLFKIRYNASRKLYF